MPEYTAKAVSVIGIGDDGCSGLNGKAMNALMKSQVLVGGERHLAFFPDFSGVQITIKGYLNEILDRIEELSGENHIAVLASGDPMFFGIGSRLIEKLGREHVEVIPHPGAMQYAFSKIGIKWDDCEWISLHGRKNHSFITSLKRMSKVIFFTDDRMNPAA
ncbi:MAG: precorrin-6y C5,15-methyltransferase (decarboxylating) subunit CbiE, partial [Spirochaetia bacterium]|nr:precorrin-6y C5,15-methyltransferase (decarboxylating) subunit CbiE [Spirochaetia bacterium]